MRTWHIIRRDGTRCPVEIRGTSVTLVSEDDVVEVTLDDTLPDEEDDELHEIVRDVMDDMGL